MTLGDEPTDSEDEPDGVKDSEDEPDTVRDGDTLPETLAETEGVVDGVMDGDVGTTNTLENWLPLGAVAIRV